MLTVAGTPQRGALTIRGNELIKFARKQGYRRDELIAVIEAAPYLALSWKRGGGERHGCRGCAAGANWATGWLADGAGYRRMVARCRRLVSAL